MRISRVAFLGFSSISRFSPLPLLTNDACAFWRENNRLNYRKMNSRSHLSFDGSSSNRQQLLVQLKICAARLMGPRCFLNTKALFVFTFQFFAIPT
ncbi:hypothetical protein T01_11702 [Trichinella spiralis]|uniref:Uncharacterized protein n=1 Tax=Trichinella spiralis TaxID=6334 RepID=A0A0V1BJS2_TRISP|nr:hypothetical protein T01_11702 [Trichinella spiralis]